jgi:hypothetical protein
VSLERHGHGFDVDKDDDSVPQRLHVRKPGSEPFAMEIAGEGLRGNMA